MVCNTTQYAPGMFGVDLEHAARESVVVSTLASQSVTVVFTTVTVIRLKIAVTE